MSTTMQNSRTRKCNRQPVSGRGGYPSFKRESSEPEPSNSPIRGLYRDPRTAMMMCSFMGTRTSVKTRSGSTYKGHTIGFSHLGDIALTDAKLDDDDNNQNPSLPGLIIPKNTFVVCKTNGVDLKGLCSASVDFTDSGIVGRMNGSSETPMRELQPWDDDDAPDVNPSLSLDDANDGWDSNTMFQANRDKFNLQTTYNEDLPEYTTKLPEPGSEGYEERQKFAQKQAQEIEQSEAYQNRIAKELGNGDEEAQFSAVHRTGEVAHRLHESNNDGGKNVYTIPALRADSEQGIKNGTLKGPGRGVRHNSPYSPTPSHTQQQQQHHHQNVPQNTRQMNNHYQGPPPSGGPLNRNQGPGSIHSRQHGPQNHAVPQYSHHQQHPAQQYQQQPPPPHPGMHHHQPPVSQHQPHVSQQQQQQHQRPSPQQLVNPGSQNPTKPHPPHPHPQNVPPALPPLSQQPPPQPQRPPHPQRGSPPHPQVPLQHPPAAGKVANINGPSGPPHSNHPYRQVSTEGKNTADVMCQKVPPMDVAPQAYHQKPSGHQVGPGTLGGYNLSASSSSNSLADTQQMPPPGPPSGTSPPSALVPDRRVGHGVDTGPEERNKIGQSLHDFKRNFVLESNGVNQQESPRPVDMTDNASVSSTPASSSVASTPVNPEPEMVAQLTEQPVDVALRRGDKADDEVPQAPKSKLNPNAKEFKPKTQPAQMEAQSPPPQPRSSPHMPQMVHYPPQQAVLMSYPYIMTNQLTPQRKRATVSLGAGVVSDLTAHQVTGQPLLATQPPSMMYTVHPSQPLPAGYQLYSPQIINPRMVGPGSLTMAQTGQMAGLDQAAAQNQSQPVFMTAQQSIPTPIPAHLHHQPTHAQAMPHPSSNQQVQPAHVPNPAPSPVQQHNSQPLPQQHPHHISQGPSQSATPQPAHYPQMTLNYTHGIPTVPRTSMSGQQNMPTGHSSMGFMSGPQFTYNGNTAQYAFAPAPQTQQSSSHGSGPQTHQYVVMPQPNPQGHPSMQQHTAQPYTGIPYQSQHLMQGPPQMPPGHNQNPNQGSPHLIHPGMPAGMHQQVPGGQPGMYMQVPSTLQYHQQ